MWGLEQHSATVQNIRTASTVRSFDENDSDAYQVVAIIYDKTTP